MEMDTDIPLQIWMPSDADTDEEMDNSDEENDFSDCGGNGHDGNDDDDAFARDLQIWQLEGGWWVTRDCQMLTPRSDPSSVFLLRIFFLSEYCILFSIYSQEIKSCFIQFC